LSLRDNSPCAAKSDESLKGLRSSIRQRFLDKLCPHMRAFVFSTVILDKNKRKRFTRWLV
jgi:hypothetical protein